MNPDDLDLDEGQRWLDRVAARLCAVVAGAMVALGVVATVRDTVPGGLVLIVCGLALCGVALLLDSWAEE